MMYVVNNELSTDKWKSTVPSAMVLFEGNALVELLSERYLEIALCYFKAWSHRRTDM